MRPLQEIVRDRLFRLKDYCEQEGYRGWDPYDGLTSRIFQAIPLIRNSRFFRLAWIQLFKRNPLNLRRFALIEKSYNPKGLGLFLSGTCNLYHLDPTPEALATIRFLTDKIISLKTKGYSGSCWGYNFDWQSRAFFQPAYSPTVVVTSYIGSALADAYEITKDKTILKELISIADFILKDLNRTYDSKGNFAFSYSPQDKTTVYNASLHGSRILARIYSYTREQQLIDEARRSVQFCIERQHNDGSWTYGTLPHHQWTDSFHTGFNLECLQEYQKYSGDRSVIPSIEKGLNYYLTNFFTTEGNSKYYNDKIWPIDVHASAQLIVTLCKLNQLEKYTELTDKVLSQTFEHLSNGVGYFYYQRSKYFTNKIPYMRWSQAWMFYALSEYLRNAD
ncbi:MAG: delta-aminolevulinic acid dehydratase, partial [Bacteroidota bacterium]|nr:delta-aminolevulinic acid dehydratase [Bacteroidota bacterium]